MAILHYVSYAAAVVAFAFVTLSLASGLLWIAEVIEEHSQTAKTVGKRAIYAVIAFHVILYLGDGDLPLKHTVFSIFCHLVYLTNFHTFPVINLTSLSFIASCILVVTDHFLWFFYWSAVVEEARRASRRWRHPAVDPPVVIPKFIDMATFFGICVWLVPLFLFLSLTANENALPTSTSIQISGTEGERKVPRQSLFVSASSKIFGLLPGRFRRKDTQTLIAPISIPSRPSSPIGGPLLSPTFQPRPSSPSFPPPPRSPSSHMPLPSPSASQFGTNSWIPVDRSRTPPRPDSPTTEAPYAGGLTSHSAAASRRRINLQPPPTGRTSGS